MKKSLLLQAGKDLISMLGHPLWTFFHEVKKQSRPLGQFINFVLAFEAKEMKKSLLLQAGKDLISMLGHPLWTFFHEVKKQSRTS